jgi:SufS family cysteine desulfurase
MTINNIPPIEPSDIPFDPAALAALAAEYFPEFQEKSNPVQKQTGVEESKQILENDHKLINSLPVDSQDLFEKAIADSFPQNVLPEQDDFSKSIPDSDLYYTSIPRGDIPFSFVDFARPIYSVTESTAQQKSQTLIKETPAKELSSPSVESGVTKNLEYKKFVTPGFLESVRPLDDIPFTHGGGSIAPVVIPTVGVGSDFFDVQAIRRDFSILSETVNGRPLVWFDNAATTQKPTAVIERLKYFYEHENSNVHRGAHTLAARSTDAYENARSIVAKHLHASSTNEIVFVRGTTEGINLIAQTWGKKNIGRGDEIILSHLEHHANIVPWQILAYEVGAKLRIIPVDENGELILSEYAKLLNPKTKFVAVTHVSNALGTVTPVADIVALAHQQGAKVLIDGAQSVSHLQVDVQALDTDFFVFSGHKIFAPTGIGVVYGKEELLNSLPPYQAGGNMIADVTFEKTVYQQAPARFEAGTGNIADAVGLGAALEYVNSIGIENIARYEHFLLEYGTEALQRIPGLRIIGTAKEKASVLSFILNGFTTEEVGKALSAEGIAVRAGHHCAQPILRRFGLESTVRPSLAFYNTCDEIDTLVAAIWNLKSNRQPGIF